MGQCYSVTMKLKYDSEEVVRSKLAEVMQKQNCNWNDTDWRWNLKELLRAFTYVEDSDYSVRQLKNGTYELKLNSNFDQCYSWERMLGEIFIGLESVLNNGSFMTVYPDSDYDRYVIKNGECIQTH